MNPTPDQEFARLHRQLATQLEAKDHAGSKSTVAAMLAIRPGDPDTLRMQQQVERNLNEGLGHDTGIGLAAGLMFAVIALVIDGQSIDTALGIVIVCGVIGAITGVWRRARRQIQIRR